VNLTILEEHGYASALLGLSLSYNQDPTGMPAVARRLCFKGDGHNKFLESLVVWLDMTAPRYFWQQFDTYRIGATKQSESTMHTMTRTRLSQAHFEHPIPDAHLVHLNELVDASDWEGVKRDLPESFLQRRIVCTNYMTIQRMARQRETHRLSEWRTFVQAILRQAQHPELLKEGATE